MEYTREQEKFMASQSYGEKNSVGPAIPVGPLDEIGIALHSARELTARIRAIAEKALGPIPEAVSEEKRDPTLPGTIPRLQDLASDTRDEINAANRACARLESALGA